MNEIKEYNEIIFEDIKHIDKNGVEYSLDSNMTQTMIAEYKLKLIDKKLLENKLREVKNLIDSNKELELPNK